MVDVDFKIVISGIIALTAIEMTLILCDKGSELITTSIIGAIALAIGVLIPSPKVDNNKGVLKW